MGEGLNRVILMGYLGADPELRHTGQGMAVLTVSLATTESYLDRQKERKERTEWHTAVVFGGRAEALAKVLTKGMAVVVEGSLRTSTFETGGVKRSKTEILAREICFAGKKADALPDTDITLPTATPAHRNGKNGTPAGYSEQMMDEIPF